MPELVTLGETMVVFDSVSNGPLRYASNYTCHTGGAETTVAVGVVRQGHTAGWISSLGDDEFGMLIRRTFHGRRGRSELCCHRPLPPYGDLLP